MQKSFELITEDVRRAKWNNLVNEKRNDQFFPGNCIYIPENYPEDWRERLEAGEVVSYEEDGEQCEIWLDMEEEE